MVELSPNRRRSGSSLASAVEPRLHSEQQTVQQPKEGNGDERASSSVATASSSVAPTTVASLIQSAAKMSLLDSDRNGSTQDVRRSAHEPTRLFDDDEYDNMDQAYSLRSLQKAVLPAMPDEQDRKRFVGCLAAVIASLYDYDEADSNGQSTVTNLHSLDASNSFYESLHNDDEEEDYSRDCVESVLTGSAANTRQRNGGIPRRAATTRNQEPGSSLPKTQSDTNQPHRDAAAARSQSRHRQRRYTVLSRLLASSAELLQLDRVHGMGLLPVLDKLLAPTAKKRPKGLVRDKFASEADFLAYHMDRIEHLRPFLDGFGAGAGLRCLVMFLLQHLLLSPKGYDARVRHAVKTVGVLVLVHDSLREKSQQFNDEQQNATRWRSDSAHRAHDDNSSLSTGPERSEIDFVTLATRKFECLERFLAVKLVELSKAQHTPVDRQDKRENSGSLTSRGIGSTSREKIIRGLKIGGTAVAAGTLFAITGGLAAPGIAAGIAAIAGTTAVAAAAAALTTTAAVTTIFGVGGGGLVAYKMQRRTVGLTEFEFCKESSAERLVRLRAKPERDVGDDDLSDVELFSTVCISGWLRDDCDFQRPWGLSPTRPPIEDRLELLERFYSVHRPGHVSRCAKILENWKGEENELWSLIRCNYGRDPDHLFPLVEGPRYRGNLSLEEKEVVTQLLAQLGCASPAFGPNATMQNRQQTPFERMKHRGNLETRHSLPHSSSGQQMDELIISWADDDSLPSETTPENESDASKMKHLSTVWDYRATYGGELYTVRWESSLLEELCNSVTELAAGVVTGATTHLLKFTALSTLVAAIALPAALKSAANLIDGTWTLVVERADEAGRELAQSLLFSCAGNRPIALVGFSFGGRVIYSCLKELARLQEKWEDYYERQARGEVAQWKKDSYFENMREPASIVCDAILMGLPNHLSLSSWQACRRVVAGRLINCYSQNDLILSLMFQYKKFGLKPVCGTCAVNVPGVENVDVSDLVTGHQDYCLITGEILKRVRLGDPFLIDSESSVLRTRD